jgi:hypothetical protein
MRRKLQSLYWYCVLPDRSYALQKDANLGTWKLNEASSRLSQGVKNRLSTKSGSQDEDFC